MVDPIDDIARQARQGSVSAIIQVLNEKLADSGVRTRAVFDQGVLQLLCEAPKPEQLEQPVLVGQVRQILESLQPRNVRRVNINSRIVREQQLLWLEEINRDPTNQLLWSEEITLAKPSFWQRLSQDRKDPKKIDPSKTTLTKTSPRQRREKKLFWRGLIGGASLSLFLLLLGWALYSWLNPKLNPTLAEQTEADQPTGTSAGTSQAEQPSGGSATPTGGAADPFAEAVRLAESTVLAGQSAQTSAEWLEVASRWQRASDLMAQIPSQDPRYPTAQDRVQLYRQNSEAALAQAQKLQ
ncbi:MAG: hypothetical protein EDM05_58520 [Leptolyngbya sp. IPPAS B-1204]|nr:hypothetical protein [Elainella sp. C42_A2020_010]RNJ65815.1 MAG: hypothetical protein EDM05_29210 [Leptolyngbya sp. IPPAS B-1204]